MLYPDICKLLETIDRLGGTRGQYNYTICELLLHYIRRNGESYEIISDAVCIPLDASTEIRRRVMEPYEDAKIKENGDIL